MGDKVEARGRDEERKGHKLHRRLVLHARGALLPDRRALHAAALAAQHGRLRQVGEDRSATPPRSSAARASSRSRCRTAARACRRCWCIPIRPRPAASPRRRMVFFDGFDITKEMQYVYGVPDLAARGIGCLIVDGPGNGESVRFRNLPLIAETEHYATAGLRISRRPPRVRSQAHRRDGAISLGGYYAPRAASLEPRFACCIAWGAQWDYHDDLGEAASTSLTPARCCRCRCRRSI